MDIFRILLIVAVIAVMVFLGCYFAAKRRKELLAWATAHGLGFSPNRNSQIVCRYPSFHCLTQGDNRYAYNLIAGRWANRDLCTFDYHYETYSTDSKGRRQTHPHSFSAVVLSSAVPLKPLFIRPEGFFDKITEFFGFDDIDFESAEFSRKFYVKSPDKKWAYDVIHQRTMEFLLGMPGFTVEFAAHAVIAYKSILFQISDFERAIKVIEGILDRLPEYLVQQQIDHEEEQKGMR
jgi:hypothetical protein